MVASSAIGLSPCGTASDLSPCLVSFKRIVVFLALKTHFLSLAVIEYTLVADILSQYGFIMDK